MRLGKALPELNQGQLNYLRCLILEIIGEDEKLKPEASGSSNLLALTRNQLRATQREQVGECLK